MNLYRNNLTIGDIPQLDVVVPSFFPKTGLVAYYKLDGNSNDSVGSNNGTDTNVSYVAGKIGNAASFNGSSSRIDFPSSLPDFNEFSISSWIKTTAHSANQGFIYEQKNTANNANIDYKVINSKFHCLTFNGTTAKGATSDTSVNDGNWHHLVATRSGATIKLYIDGNLDKTITDGHTITIGSDSGVIGRHPSGVAYFNGSIDEVGIWNRALTSDEITKLYNNGNGLTY